MLLHPSTLRRPLADGFRSTEDSANTEARDTRFLNEGSVLFAGDLVATDVEGAEILRSFW